MVRKKNWLPKGSWSNVVSIDDCSALVAVPNIHNRADGRDSSATSLARLN